MTVIGQFARIQKNSQCTKHMVMVATVTRHAVQHGESRRRPQIIKKSTANGNHHRQYRHSNQHRPINLRRIEKEGGGFFLSDARLRDICVDAGQSREWCDVFVQMAKHNTYTHTKKTIN